MTSTNPKFRIARVALLPLALLVSSCTSDSSGPNAVPIEQTTFASALGVNLSASTRTAGGAYYRDIVVGPGAIVAGGQRLTVRYTGWLSDGTQFDSNVGAASAFPFTLGVRQVIDGWDETLPGARVGGKRQLVIPPSLGYGASGYGPIPGNAVIVFNVDIISAQ